MSNVKKQWKVFDKNNRKWAMSVHADNEKQALKVARDKWPGETFNKAQFLK